jgi:polyisoprenyl-teichoic acid--peptidoglycan teichoic acid transferase
VISFLGRFAIALVVVSLLSTVALVGGKAYGRRMFQRDSTVIHLDDGVLTPVREGKPANYLLLGSDVRPKDETPQEAAAYGTSKDTGGARSDVMMILHVDPAAHRSMLVSFPRDLVVQIPGHGLNLLNAAYGFGGAKLVIQTFEQNFPPMKINHYLEVDFRGFKKIVNTIGHVNIYFPTPANDEFTGLHVNKAGCVSLNGDEALAYARSRHYNIPRDPQNPAPWQPSGTNMTSPGWIQDARADLDRIPRQQYFLRTLSRAAVKKAGSDPLGINSLLGAIFKNLAHDQYLTYDEITSLAYTFRDLNPSKVDMSTLPVANSPYRQFPAQVVAKFPDAVGVINQLASFTPPKKPIVKPMSAARIKVRVVNGSGVKNAASHVLDTFEAAGFHSAGPPADADRADYNTEVRYAPGKFREGYTVAIAVGTIHLVEAPSAKNTFGGDALLIVGRDYDSLRHRFDLVPRPANLPPPSSTTTFIAPGTTTSTTVAQPTIDSDFVPVDPHTGGTLVGCPAK